MVRWCRRTVTSVRVRWVLTSLQALICYSARSTGGDINTKTDTTDKLTGTVCVVHKIHLEGMAVV